MAELLLRLATLSVVARGADVRLWRNRRVAPTTAFWRSLSRTPLIGKDSKGSS